MKTFISPFHPCGPVSSFLTVMFRLLLRNRNIGLFVCMFLVLRLCFLWRNTCLSRVGNSRTTQWFLGCPKRFEHIGLSGGSAGTPTCYFFGVFCSLVLVVSGTGSGAAWSVTLSTFGHLLVLHHRLLSDGIDVQIDSASLLLVQRLAVPGTCHNGDRARR